MRRHELDVVSLVFGLLFVGAAAIWGLPGDAADAVHGGRVPALLIVVGLIGLLTSIGTRRSRSAAGVPTSGAASFAPDRPAGRAGSDPPPGAGDDRPAGADPADPR